MVDWVFFASFLRAFSSLQFTALLRGSSNLYASWLAGLAAPTAVFFNSISFSDFLLLELCSVCTQILGTIFKKDANTWLKNGKGVFGFFIPNTWSQVATSNWYQFGYGGPFSVPVLRSSMAQRSEPRFAKPPERAKRGPPAMRQT